MKKHTQSINEKSCFTQLTNQTFNETGNQSTTQQTFELKGKLRPGFYRDISPLAGPAEFPPADGGAAMFTRLGERGGTGGGGPLELPPGLKAVGTRSLSTAGRLTGVLEFPPTLPPTLFPALLVLAPVTELYTTVEVGTDNAPVPVGCVKAEPIPTAPVSNAERSHNGNEQ